MSAPVKLALLGAGGRARGTVCNWLKDPDCQLVAVVDPSQESLDKTRSLIGDKAPKARYIKDVQGWLKDPQADIVTINSWDPQHAENAIDSFRAGVHVHVAKPMTQTLQQADAVWQAWRESGRIGIVDMQIRYASVTREVKALLDSGVIGTVRNVICMDYVGRSGCFFRAQRSRRHDQIVSLTLAKGVHFLDLCNYFMGDEPVRAFASASTQVFGGDAPNDLHCRDCDKREGCQWDGEKGTIHGESYPFRQSLCVYANEIDIPDNTSAVIDYRRGGKAMYFECYYTPEYETVYDIIGEKGALKLRYGMDNHLWLELRDRPSRTITHRDFFAHGAHGGGDVALVNATLAAVRANRQIHPTIADGRHAVALCCAIDESAHTGLPATIPPLPQG